MPESKLIQQIERQVSSLLFLETTDSILIEKHIEEASVRTAYCFSHLANKYYCERKIDPLHTGQYTTFLYFLSNTIFRHEGSVDTCDKIYFLLKTFSSCDLFYEVRMPDVFFFDHPFASVLGRADYSDRFMFLQGCTVGQNRGNYPAFGKNVFMLSGSKVLGDCHIGDNVIISANTYIKDVDIPSGSIIFGQDRNIVVQTGKTDYVCEFAKTYFVD